MDPSIWNPQMIVVLATIHQKVIGRFGIVTEPGPIVPPPLEEAIQRIYSNSNSSSSRRPHDDDDNDTIRAGAIVYMYVEPEYRGNEIGSMALHVIHTIQRSCQCTYTLLVANDKTPSVNGANQNNNADGDHQHNDRKLVQWYRRHGYHVTEEIQDMLGSPNGIYGFAMATSLFEEEKLNRLTPIIQWW